MSTTSIAAIIPAYNAEQYLAEAIESVLNQTRAVDQIIVVDDCSTDRTKEVASSFDRVTYLKTPTNGGHAAARNLAIAEVNSDYIAWLDADDYWEPTHLEIVAALLDKYPEAGVACSQCRNFGAVSGIRRCLVTDEKPRNATEDCFRWTCVPAMSAITRTAPTVEVNGFDASYRTAPDFDFWLRMSLVTQFISTQTVTVNYRWHAGQISSQSKGQSRSIRQIRSMYRARHEFSMRNGLKQKQTDLQSRIKKSFHKDLGLIRAYYSDKDFEEFRAFTDEHMQKGRLEVTAERLLANTPKVFAIAWLKAKRIPAKLIEIGARSKA